MTSGRGNIEELAARNQRIRLELVRGHSIGSVAARYKLGERQVRNIWNQRGEAAASEQTSIDARQAVLDEIDFLDALLAECVERGETTENDSVWLGSVRTRLEIRRQRIELSRLYGMLPRGYDQIELQRRLGELITAVTATLERNDVPEVVIREIDELRRADAETAEQTLALPLLPGTQGKQTLT